MDTTQVITALLLSAGLAALFTWLMIPWLRRLKAGQSIREEGPEAHKAKSGTPTMGGIAMILAMCIAGLLMSPSKDMLVCLGCTLAYGLIGFIDDYIKVVKKRNLGLTPIQKLLLQLIVAVLVAIYVSKSSTEVYIPFFNRCLDFGILYIPFAVFVMVAMTNAVNLTDGLDGLASSVTAYVSVFFMAVTTGSVQFFCICICGACLGFLLFNKHPAKIFMGDTGSLALGAALTSAAMLSHYEFMLPITGGIYVAEALSVIIQVFVFKTQNGRRFFRMAPLHHHFELGGWNEVKVVRVFSVVTLLLVVFARMILVIGGR